MTTSNGDKTVIKKFPTLLFIILSPGHFHYNCRFYANFFPDSNPSLVRALMANYNVAKTAISLMHKMFILVMSRSCRRALLFPSTSIRPSTLVMAPPHRNLFICFLVLFVFTPNTVIQCLLSFWGARERIPICESRYVRQCNLPNYFRLALFKRVLSLLTCNFASMVFRWYFQHHSRHLMSYLCYVSSPPPWSVTDRVMETATMLPDLVTIQNSRPRPLGIIKEDHYKIL